MQADKRAIFQGICCSCSKPKLYPIRKLDIFLPSGAIEYVFVTPEGEIYSKHMKRKEVTDNGNGYLTFAVCLNGEQRRILVHRAVAKCYLPDYLLKREVNHINFDRKDNRLENLEMYTSQENKHHAIKGGRTVRIQRYDTFLKILQLHHMEKKTIPEIRDILGVKTDFVRSSLIGETKTYLKMYLDEGNLYNISEFRVVYFGLRNGDPRRKQGITYKTSM